MKREVTAYMISIEKDLFLLGRNTIKELRVRVDHDENKLEFKEENKKFGLIEKEEGHLIAQVELVRKWEDMQYIN